MSFPGVPDESQSDDARKQLWNSARHDGRGGGQFLRLIGMRPERSVMEQYR